jgi:hypothetical protein
MVFLPLRSAVSGWGAYCRVAAVLPAGRSVDLDPVLVAAGLEEGLALLNITRPLPLRSSLAMTEPSSPLKSLARSQ